jgi:hypothetical protein
MDHNQRRGIHALASMLPRVTAPIFKKRGFAEAGILTDWPAIVGEHLARHTMPEKIAFPRNGRSAGILHIVTESAFAPELQHLEPQVLERINGYFGYFAVARLRIQHGRVVRAPLDRGRPAGKGGALSSPQNPGTQRSGKTDGSAHPAVRQATAGVEDEPLRAALERLGTAVRDRQEPGPETNGRAGPETRGGPGPETGKGAGPGTSQG